MEPLQEVLRRELVGKSTEEAIEMAERYGHEILIVSADGESFFPMAAGKLITATIYVATEKGKIVEVVWIEGEC